MAHPRRIAGVVSVCFLAIVGMDARAQGFGCAPELTNDCNLDASDVIEFLVRFNNADPSVDFNQSGTHDFLDVIDFLILFGQGCNYPDSDGDRLNDCVETNTGVFVDNKDTGTDPNDDDTDDDGIKDGDEVLGTEDGLDLPMLGATPLERNIFVEIDWFSGTFEGSARNFQPTAAIISAITSVYSSAPVNNPDGTTGINIIIDYGQGAPFTGGNQLPGSPDFIAWDADFNTFKGNNFAANRKGYFHYAIFCNRYDAVTNNSSGVAELPGDDFIVSLYSAFNTFNAATTFVHEIGHNLNLRHGGSEDRNYKPNYNSVMNYRHQFTGADTDFDSIGDGVIAYSTGLNFDIDEDAIFELDGVQGVPIDFDNSSVIDIAPYALNINCATGTAACGTMGTCWDSSCDLLKDFHDWNNIDWTRLTATADRLPPEMPRPVLIECDNWPGK